MIHAVLTAGEGVADDHQPGSLQLAVGFPFRVHVNVPVPLDVQAEQGQGFAREHGTPPGGIVPVFGRIAKADRVGWV
jgi:hypothetical protein